MADCSSSISFSARDDAPGRKKGSPRIKRQRKEPPSQPIAAKFALVIRKQPTYVFSNETIEIEFSIERLDRRNESTAAEIPTALEIHTSTTSVAVTLDVQNEPRLTPTQQTDRVVAQLQTQTTEVRSFCFRLETDHPSIVQPVTSHEISIVRAKLQASSDSWSSIWYKDEGGRDKCMEVSVTAQQADGSPATASDPLQIQLCYAGNAAIPVTNQDILRVIGSARKLTLDRNGQAKIHFRIDDVSKNHQNQDFVLQIGHSDMAPCVSPAVTIRSKRNKKRQSSQQLEASATMPAMLPTTGPARGNVNQEQLRDALHGVFQWTDDVVRGIYAYQWSLVGYHRHPDGTENLSQPLYNMQNPNTFITRILATYNESTRRQLQQLQDHFGGSGVSMLPMGSGMPMDAVYHFGQPTAGIHHPPHPFAPPMRRDRGDYYDHYGSAAAGREAQDAQPPYAAAGGGTSGASSFEREFLRDNHDSLVDALEDESDSVEFVVVQLQKSSLTSEPLGYPAYSEGRDLLGFFQLSEPSRPFRPIRSSGSVSQQSRSNNNDPYVFGDAERQDATALLQRALSGQHAQPPVYCRRNYGGSLARMVDAASVAAYRQNL